MTTATCPTSKTNQSPPLPEIKVNGVVISQQELAKELQYHPDDQFERVVYQSARALIIRQLLKAQVADRLSNGEASDADEEALIAELIAENTQVDLPDEAQCRRYYQQNRTKFSGSPILEVDHILLAAAPDDLDQRDQMREKAESLIAKILLQPQRFADYAARYSSCPSKSTGGSLGQISRGQTVPEFEKAILHLQPGLVEHPIESRYGFHIVWIRRRIEGKAQSFEMVQHKISQYLLHRKKNLAVQKYVYELLQDAEIEGIEISFDDENIYH